MDIIHSELPSFNLVPESLFELARDVVLGSTQEELGGSPFEICGELAHSILLVDSYHMVSYIRNRWIGNKVNLNLSNMNNLDLYNCISRTRSVKLVKWMISMGCGFGNQIIQNNLAAIVIASRKWSFFVELILRGCFFQYDEEILLEAALRVGKLGENHLLEYLIQRENYSDEALVTSCINFNVYPKRLSVPEDTIARVMRYNIEELSSHLLDYAVSLGYIDIGGEVAISRLTAIKNIALGKADWVGLLSAKNRKLLIEILLSRKYYRSLWTLVKKGYLKKWDDSFLSHMYDNNSLGPKDDLEFLMIEGLFSGEK